jgi:hypothetical protein
LEYRQIVRDEIEAQLAEFQALEAQVQINTPEKVDAIASF